MRRIVIHSPGADRYYFLNNTVFIRADHPEAAELIERCPQLPAVNTTALELILKLTHRTATAEAKIELLKDAIKAL